MFARVARYQIPQGRFGEVISAFREPFEKVREIDGNIGGYLLIDRDNCIATTLTFWESQAALEASEVSARRLRTDAVDVVEGEVSSVDRAEVALDLSGQPAQRT